MGKVFLTIAGTVVVLNILLLLLPDGKYEKYVRFTAGLIVLLTVFGSIFRLNPDHAALNFDKNAYTLENEGVLETARKQIAEKSIAEKIKEETGIETTVSVVLENDKIKSVHVSGCGEKKRRGYGHCSRLLRHKPRFCCGTIRSREENDE